MDRSNTALRLGMVVATGTALGLGSLVMAQGQPKPSEGSIGSGPRVQMKSKADPAAAQKAGAAKMDRYAKVLMLDAAQTEAAKALYEAYQKETSAAGKKTQDAMREAQEDMNSGDHTAFETKIQKAMSEQRESSKVLTDKFLDDLKSMLRPTQVDRWPSLERFRRRERYLTSMMTIGGMSVGGSAVDLFPLIEKVNIPAELKGKVDEAMGMYEVDVDRPLREREGNFTEDETKMGAVQHFDGDSFAKKQERDRGVDMAIREVNTKYVRQIATLLPEDLAKQWNDLYQAKAYRSIYKESTVAKKMVAALKMKDLTPEQASNIKALADSYKRDARAANDRWAAAQQRAETEGRPTGGGIMVLGGGESGADKIDPDVAAARSGRRTVDDGARDKLEKILTPEQLTGLSQDATGTGASSGRRVEMFGDDGGHDMMFVADLDDDDLPPGDGTGGPTMIIRTITVGGPGGGDGVLHMKGGDQSQSPPPDKPKPKPD